MKIIKEDKKEIIINFTNYTKKWKNRKKHARNAQKSMTKNLHTVQIVARNG